MVRGRLRDSSIPAPVAGLAAAAALAYFAYAWARWATLFSSAFDLAYFDQVIWNAARGHGFVSSFIGYPFFGQHFSPALAVLVPLYLVHPSPFWLLAAQSLALGAAVIPLYRLARTWFDHRAAILACCAFALQPFVLRAVGYDFHTEALAVPFVFWAVLGAVKAGRAGDFGLLTAGAVPMLCKEDGALISLGIGFLAWAVLKRRLGLVLMGVALAYGLAVTLLVMPAIRAGQPGDLAGRYSYLGTSVPGILAGLVTHPQLAIAHLAAPLPLFATVVLLGSVAFLPLARPLALLAAVPALVFALLSQHWQQEGLYDQYGLQPGPLIMVAALLGAQRLGPRARPAVVALPLIAAAAALVAGPRLMVGSWSGGAAARALVSAVPEGASVDASSDLLTMLAERDSIGILPDHKRDWIAVDSGVEPPGTEGILRSAHYARVAGSGQFSLWRRGP